MPSMPARGGDALKVGLVRAAVPGSSVATIAATMSVLVALDIVISAVLLIAVGATGAVPLDFAGAFDRVATAAPIVAGGLAAIALVGYAGAPAAAHARCAAAAGRRRPAHALRATCGRWRSPQVAAWCCRVGVVLCLLAAFGLPATVPLAALVMVVARRVDGRAAHARRRRHAAGHARRRIEPDRVRGGRRLVLAGDAGRA